MSAPERLLIKITIQEFSRANPGESLGMKRLRSELVKHRLDYSDSRWEADIKPLVREVIIEIVSRYRSPASADELMPK